MAAKQVGALVFCLGRRNAWVTTLASAAKTITKERRLSKPQGPRKGVHELEEDWGCRCRRRRGNDNAEWQDGEMMTRAISILRTASFDASLGKTIGGAS